MTHERLGPYGVWLNLLLPPNEARASAREVEQLGFAAVWIGENNVSGDIVASTSVLLAATDRIVVASGIMNIWGRDAVSAAHAAAYLGGAYPGRFVLGLGASHQSVVDRRGHKYAKPLTAMADYLDAIDSADYALPAPVPKVSRVLAALRPKMIELARERADGVHPYLTTPEHTAAARRIVGPDRLVAPEQKVLLERDPAVARRVARATVGYYLDLPNYVNNLRVLGFSDDDFSDGGSDRLIDSLVAWGDVDAIEKRLRSHLDAGADHVAIQVLQSGGATVAGVLGELAPALL